MKYDDVKVGMKVRVTGKFPNYADGWRNVWADDKMDLYIGKTYFIADVSPSGVVFEDDEYWFPWQVLELVDHEYHQEKSTFLNEEHVKFIDLTDEQKLLIIREKHNGSVERHDGVDWHSTFNDTIDFAAIYRIKPQEPVVEHTPLDIPWQFINPEYMYAAMDKNGGVYFYTVEPKTDDDVWYEATEEFTDACLLNISTTGIIWNKSLTKRPE